MTDAARRAELCKIIKSAQCKLPPAAEEMAQAIKARHGGAVRGFVFYGSALRETDAPGKMLDFYVLVDSYAAVYRNPVLRLATALLPPGVHFLQIQSDTGETLRAKYAIVAEKAFHRRVRSGLESMLWARFVQPSIIHTDDPTLFEEIVQSFAQACIHFHTQTAPLLETETDSVWERGLAESYRTELRPEQPYERAKDIVARHSEYYAKLSHAFASQQTALQSRRLCALKWWLRRVTGKPRGAARVLKAALTFDAGLDYILEKVGAHSGVEIEVSAAARRHPILFSPLIAWRLYRAGAFR